MFDKLDELRYNTTVEYLELHPELEPFVVEPSSLDRVWAGDDPEAPQVTVALLFPDEAEAAKYI